MIAPVRAARPGIAQAVPEPATVEPSCPFCGGNESATPPETFALGPPGRAADAPGWTVRVVPNKFPAFIPADAADASIRTTGRYLQTRPAVGRHEVVIHTPRHAQSLADLSVRELERVAEAWQARAENAREQGFAYVHALVNEGQAAGASLPHTHSQLVWLDEMPPAVAEERALQAEAGACVLCQVLEDELAQPIRVIAHRDGLVLLCPFAGRAPYEMLVASQACESDPFQSAALGSALSLAAEGLRRLQAAEGPVPVNAWIHASGHWHLEILPRLTLLAGIELGAGYFVNTLAPESGAALLREA